MRQRRFKNPDVTSWATLAALGVGGYLLYKFFNKGSETVDALTQSIADEYVDLTSGPSVQSQLQGQIILPGGQTFSTSQLQNYNVRWQGDTLVFTMNGITYSLASHDANGNYQATQI